MKRLFLILASVWWILPVPAAVPIVDDVHQLLDTLDAKILDADDGLTSPDAGPALDAAWRHLATSLSDPNARALVESDFSAATTPEMLAAKIGESRARIQQIAALEMLSAQRRGDVAAARTWRDLITLPKFANGDEGAQLLQQAPEQVRSPAMTRSLAREDIGWQVTRVRQLFDELQHTLAVGDATGPYVEAKLAEISGLVRFPEELRAAAGLPATAAAGLETPGMPTPYTAMTAGAAIAAWRDHVELALPNLLSPADVTRLERLLARFVDVVPKEYRNGVQGGRVVIPLEYKEAQQFTEQAQSLVNELAPVWRRDKHDVYERYRGELAAKLATLDSNIVHVRDLAVIEKSAGDVGALLQDQFGLNPRRSGTGSKIIEETAFDVRDALNNSLAAATAGHWQEAESLRLDAYTSFDSEIEIRVMPRDPELATRTERSFLDGTPQEPGIKALLDRGSSPEELSAAYGTTLKNLDSCVALLKVAVSPATIGFTAFTVLAREGLEAIVILAALLAGLRGAENLRVRRGIVQGALLGILASGLTFWLSQTIVRSLLRFGEKLEAIISILAVIILFMVTNWVFHKMYWVGWNARLRDLSRSAKSVRRPVWEVGALLGVGFLTVYREGFETTIFMQSLILEGSTSSVLLGVLAGVAFIGGIGLLIVGFGAKLPYRKLLISTGILVVSIMVTFVGSTVRLFQTVSWLPVHPLPGVSLPNWVGMWLGLYPSWEGILIPPLALVYVGGSWLYQKIVFRRAMRRAAAGTVPVVPVPAVQVQTPPVTVSR